MSIDEIIRAIQKKLGVSVDGKPGPQTWGAIYQAVIGGKKPDELKEVAGDVLAAGRKADSRSERNIATLRPEVRPYVRALVEKAAARGIIIKVISGTRTYNEQAELYKKYKAGGPLAAPPGRSNHNFGIAFDVGIFEGSSDPEKARKYVPESPAYKAVGALGVELGLDWGGNWRNTKDEPHYELRPEWAKGLTESEMVSKLAARVDKGIDPFA